MNENDSTVYDTTEGDTTAHLTNSTVHDTKEGDTTVHLTNSTHNYNTTTTTKAERYVNESTFVIVTVILSITCFALFITLIIFYVICRKRSLYGAFR